MHCYLYNWLFLALMKSLFFIQSLKWKKKVWHVRYSQRQILSKAAKFCIGSFWKKPTALDLLVPLLPFLWLQQSRFCCGDLIPHLLSIGVAALLIKQK